LLLKQSEQLIAAKDESIRSSIIAKNELNESNRSSIAAKDKEIAVKDELIAAKDESIRSSIIAKNELIAAKDESIRISIAAKDKEIAVKDEYIRSSIIAKDESIRISIAAKDESIRISIAAKDKEIAVKDEYIRSSIAAKDELIALLKETHEKSVRSLEQELLASKGLLTARGIFEHEVKKCFFERRPNGKPKRFNVTDVISEIMRDADILNPDGHSYRLVKVAKKCNCDLAELYAKLCSEIHGYPWSGPGVKVQINKMSEGDSW